MQLEEKIQTNEHAILYDSRDLIDNLIQGSQDEYEIELLKDVSSILTLFINNIESCSKSFTNLVDCRNLLDDLIQGSQDEEEIRLLVFTAEKLSKLIKE